MYKNKGLKLTMKYANSRKWNIEPKTRTQFIAIHWFEQQQDVSCMQILNLASAVFYHATKDVTETKLLYNMNDGVSHYNLILRENF